MGFLSKIKSAIRGKAMTSVQYDEAIMPNKNHALVRELKRVDYVVDELNEALPDAVAYMTNGADLSTVFICGGYAAFAAHMTTTYTDIDFFCTSRLTFNMMVRQLNLPHQRSPYVVDGTVDGIKINVIHNPNATTIEDILDEFDMTWCRVGIDLDERIVISHPEADSECPIFELTRMVAKNISKNNLVDRLFDRFCRYSARRVKPCPVPDSQIHSVLTAAVHTVKPEEVSQNRFDQTYYV